ncbi:MAG: 5'-deoxynucleotidase [Clostridia bacterium]|nr:5'-deoxynucleotidase [Clostridia bacterium]
MKNAFYGALMRMKYITRWALMPNTRPENICEHSYDVAALAHALALIENTRFGGTVKVEKCVMRALYHDLPEILTGDMPTPVKYVDERLRDAYRQVEEHAVSSILSLLPDDLRPEYAALLNDDPESEQEMRLVKAADKLSALIKCEEELKQGNREFESARNSTEKALREMNIPAVNCFLEEFLPPCRLTLDEQQRSE